MCLGNKRGAFYLIHAQMPQARQSLAALRRFSARIRAMPNTPNPTLENADIVWQESGAPYSTRFDDIYFSRQGGLEETEHVFIAANQLPARWQDRDAALLAGQEPHSAHFTIAELGFGTGLNFLCTWRAWLTAKPAKLRLHYIACEQFPLQREALSQALAQWPELAALTDILLKSYPDHSAGYHRLHLLEPHSGSSITLDLYYGDAATMLSAQATREAGKVDAWYLDGFAPRANPQMWSESLMLQLARLSKAGTTLSTYSVAGQVQRSLQAAGFALQKQPGFGRKREMLTGCYHKVEAPTPTRTNAWLGTSDSTAPCQEVIVIGAGLAGCATAHSLARKGCQVLVLEQASSIANGASGNRQAVLQCRLNNAITGSRQFNLQSFLYAVREFAALQAVHPQLHWQPCGVLNLDSAFSKRAQHCDPVDLSRYAAAVAQLLDSDASSRKAGVALDGASTFLPLGGWLRPAQLCLAYLQTPGIRVQTGCAVDLLQQRGGRWQVLDSTGALIAEAASVVIANSYQASRFSQTAALPVVPIRGQVSYVQASATSAPLRSVVCGLSYISPAFEGLHSVGASYSKTIDDLSLSLAEHRQNIAGIAEQLPAGSVTESAVSGGRVSVRGTTRDRMPLVGPVPDLAQFTALYSSLGQTARKHPQVDMPYLAGLYVSIGHGSHGLGNAPLAGEYLASVMCNETLPLQHDVIAALHPARFLLRELRRRDQPPRRTA